MEGQVTVTAKTARIGHWPSSVLLNLNNTTFRNCSNYAKLNAIISLKTPF